MTRFTRDPWDPRSLQGPAVAIVLLALLASVTSLANGFAYDDRWIIADNPNVHDPAHWWNVFGETCPQYLFLSYEDYERPGFDGAKYVMSPPLRPKGNEERLWGGLATNALQVVSTDHCSFCMKDGVDGKPGKMLGKKDFSKIPNGIGSVEHRMDLIFQGVVDGEISLERWVELCSTTPARMFGLYGRKGAIAPGADADLVLWDAGKQVTITNDILQHVIDYTPYEGMRVTGWPVATSQTLAMPSSLPVRSSLLSAEKPRVVTGIA